MTELHQVYKCNKCTNIVEVLRAGVGELVCCGEPMELVREKLEDEGQEKHVPVIEQTESGIKVKVGSMPHPMESEHYIEWIEVKSSNGEVVKKFLKPGDAPEADFCQKTETVSAREYCNIHGLWKA